MNTTSAIGSGTCGHCGMIHQGQCPRIKAIEYYPDGISVKRVEYHESRPIISGGQTVIPLDAGAETPTRR